MDDKSVGKKRKLSEIETEVDITEPPQKKRKLNPKEGENGSPKNAELTNDPPQDPVEDNTLLDGDFGSETTEFDMEDEDEDEDEGEDEDEFEEEGEEILLFDDDDGLFDESAFNHDSSESKSDFQVVDNSNLVNTQHQKVLQVAETLNVTSGTAGNLLKHYKWDVESLYNKFFDNPEKICESIGISRDKSAFMTGVDVQKKKNGGSGEEITCPICYDDYAPEDMFGLSCEHLFCKECWKNYLDVEIGDGYSCLMANCPHRECSLLINEELVKATVSEEKYKRYSQFVARSFVDDNPRIRWCPAPSCGKAIYCPLNLGKVENVKCSCGERFCFNCGQEAHEPCSCDELRKWRMKEKDEEENVNWLNAHAKFCPNCKKPIEKNGGCNHMTCGQCKHEFCWVCMDSWKEHGEKTGGYYRCNRYSQEELDEKLDLKSKSEAKSALQKYLFYFERYANHARSAKFEKQILQKAEKNMRRFQKKKKCVSWIDVEFIQNAVKQLIECRNTLKYTYIKAYYLEDETEKRMFEFLQQDLERVTEQLSEIMEGPVENYDRAKIVELTNSSKKRLKNLLTGCKDGLTRVD